MNKKRIAIIDHVGCKAGMDYYSGSLAKGFIENGISCTLFSNVEIEGVPCYSFFRKKKGSIVSSILNQIIPFRKAITICKKENIQEVIIHLFSFELKDLLALSILKRGGLKIISIVHDVEHLAIQNDRFRKKILEQYCTKIMVHNEFSFNTLTKFYPALSNRVKVVPHMNFHTLPQEIQMTRTKNKWNLSDGIHLLFFGQIKEAKGLEILLKAMSQVSNTIHLIIAGKQWHTSFEQYDYLIKKHKLQDRVSKHIRYITDEERNELFAICDAVVLPYKKIFQSGVMQVAISYQIPIICSDIEPFKEVIQKEEFGYLFTSEDSKSLAKKITQLANNQQQAKQKAMDAYRMAMDRFSNQSIAKSISEW